MIHEFKISIPVHTPHGEGQAILIIDYGIDANSVWMVRLSGGHINIIIQTTSVSTTIQ